MKVSIIFLLIFHCYFSLNAQWESTKGLLGGPVSDFAATDSTIYVSTFANGLYMSTDEGSNWTQINTGENFFQITCIEVIGPYLFIGSNAGLFSTKDNGKTWTKYNNLIIASVSTFYNDGANIYAGTPDGVFITTDSGVSWTALGTGFKYKNIHCLTINDSFIFAGTASGIYRYNFNNIWTDINHGFFGSNVYAMASKGNDIYACVSGRGIYKSTDNGDFWSLIMSDYGTIMSMLIEGENIYASRSEVGILLNSMGGNSWDTIAKNLANTEITSMMLRNGNLFAGTLSGIFISPDTGKSWIRSNDGIVNAQASTISVNGDNLYAGTDGGSLFLYLNTGNNWKPLSNTPECRYSINSMIVCNGKIFAASSGSSIVRSEDQGKTWTNLRYKIGRNDINSLAVSGSRIFAGNTSGIYASDDDGDSWYAMNNGIAVPDIYALAAYGDTVFAATYQDIYVSFDKGKNWTKANGSMTNYLTRMIAVGSNTVFASSNHGLYLSKNNGLEWTDISKGLKNNYVNCLVTFGNTYLAGTESAGIFRSTDNGLTWKSFNEGLYDSSIRSLAIFHDTLFAGTGNMGIWKYALNNLPLEIKTLGFKLTFNIFPNPTKGLFNIVCSGPAKSLYITDVSGRLIYYKDPFWGKEMIDLSDLQAGIYFVSVKDGKSTSTQKLVLE